MRKHLILAVASVLLAGRASAGPLDSPLPALSGGKASLYGTISGVVNAGGLATLISCTNQGPEAMPVTIGLFVDVGGDPCNNEVTTAVTIAPGGTELFSTGNNIASSYFSTHPISTPEMFISVGSARIVVGGKGAFCHAVVSDMYNSPPSTSYTLPIALKGKPR